MKRIGLIAVAAVLLASTAAFFAASGPASAVAPPPAGGYFTRSPAGSALPSEATCAAAVHHSTWEPRADNVPYNTTVATAAQLASFQSQNLDPGDFDATGNGPAYKGRVTGNYVGTTDEEFQFYSCKWGLADEDLRAQAVDETNWHQNGTGDFTSNFANCPSDAVYNGAHTQCAQSYGMIQDKWIYNKIAYPMSRYSTPFHLDYNLMKLRACFDGHSIVNGVSHVGDWNGCLGNWFSGGWHDADAEAYVARNQQFYAEKAWLTWADQGVPTTTTTVAATTTTGAATTTTAAATTTTGAATTTTAPATTTTAATTTTVVPTTTTVAPTTTTRPPVTTTTRPPKPCHGKKCRDGVRFTRPRHHGFFWRFCFRRW